jgi:hypothetical protein
MDPQHCFLRRTLKNCMYPRKPNLLYLPLRSYHTQAAPPCIREESLQKSMYKLSFSFFAYSKEQITKGLFFTAKYVGGGCERLLIILDHINAHTDPDFDNLQYFERCS